MAYMDRHQLEQSPSPRRQQQERLVEPRFVTGHVERDHEDEGEGEGGGDDEVEYDVGEDVGLGDDCGCEGPVEDEEEGGPDCYFLCGAEVWVSECAMVFIAKRGMYGIE